jgi:hypothetical protein
VVLRGDGEPEGCRHPKAHLHLLRGMGFLGGYSGIVDEIQPFRRKRLHDGWGPSEVYKYSRFPVGERRLLRRGDEKVMCARVQLPEER